MLVTFHVMLVKPPVMLVKSHVMLGTLHVTHRTSPVMILTSPVTLLITILPEEDHVEEVKGTWQPNDLCVNDSKLFLLHVNSGGCIFSHVRPFYERAVSDPDP